MVRHVSSCLDLRDFGCNEFCRSFSLCRRGRWGHYKWGGLSSPTVGRGCCLSVRTGEWRVGYTWEQLCLEIREQSEKSLPCLSHFFGGKVWLLEEKAGGTVIFPNINFLLNSSSLFFFSFWCIAHFQTRLFLASNKRLIIAIKRKSIFDIFFNYFFPTKVIKENFFIKVSVCS